MTAKEKRDDPLSGVRCQATARSGQRCRKAPVPGGVTCEFHGSGTRSAKQAGLARLAAFVPRAIKNMTRLADQRRDLKVSLGANKDILDRAGLAPAEQVNSNITYAWEDEEPPPPAST
jgi:hypothetical protein